MQKNFILIICLGFLQLFFAEKIVSQQTSTVVYPQLTSDTIKAAIIKENLLINSLEGEFGAMQSDVQVAMSGIGTYAFCWYDYRNNKKEIYFQVYDRHGKKVNANTKIETYETLSDNPPFITASKNGLFIVGWIYADGRIAAKKFNSYAEPLGSTMYFNSFPLGEISNLWITFNSDQSILATWNERSGSSSNRIRYYYNLQGYVDDNGGYNIQSYKNTSAIDENKNALVTWYGYKNDTSFIYLQRILYGSPIWDNIVLHSAKGRYSLATPQISHLKDGNFIVVWNETDSTMHSYLKYRLVNAVGLPVTEPRICAMYNYEIALKTVINNKNDKFYVSFFTGGETYVVEISADGRLLTSPIVLADDSPFTLLSQEISDVFENNILIASDYVISANNYSKNVGYYKISTNLNDPGNLIKINDDICTANQQNTVIKFNSQGKAIAVWVDERTGKKELYAQVFDQGLVPIGANFRITDSLNNYNDFKNLIIDAYPDGNFLIGFAAGNYYTNYSLMLQQITSDGNLISKNKYIGINFSYNEVKFVLKVNSLSEVLVCSYNENDVAYAIYNRQLDVVRNLKSLKQPKENFVFKPINVSVDTSFNIFVACGYYDFSNYYYEPYLFGSFFNRKGDSIKDEFKFEPTYYYSDQFLAGENNGLDFVIVFKHPNGNFKILRSYNDQTDTYYLNSIPSLNYIPTHFNFLRFENKKSFITYTYAGSLYGLYLDDTKRKNKLYLLSNPQNQNFYHSGIDYGVALSEDKILISSEFESTTRTGLDVYTSFVKIDNLNYENDFTYMPVSSDYLYNNFPNPFNPKTKIVYEILSYHQVKLSVFNILGQEVKVLVDTDQEPGLYEVDFDATGLASGIYFYKLEAFNTSIKKMIYLK